jgi:hypothetical protein
MVRQMKPRHIAIIEGLPTPLTGVFGKSEVEQAAAMLLLGMQAEDSWEGVSPAQIGLRLRELSDDNATIRSWLHNPFVRPDIDWLIAGGFAEWVGDEGEGCKRPVRFTAQGLEALRHSRWNTCTVTVCSECLRALCWQGKHYCEDCRGAFSAEKTPFQLLQLQKDGKAKAEDSSYWDVCNSCGTACGGKCAPQVASSRAVRRTHEQLIKDHADRTRRR